MRIHIFRRDRRLEEARQAKNEKARREALFIAFRENLILERYFGRALEKSGYKWDAEQRTEAAAANDAQALPQPGERRPLSGQGNPPLDGSYPGASIHGHGQLVCGSEGSTNNLATIGLILPALFKARLPEPRRPTPAESSRGYSALGAKSSALF